MTTKSDDDRFTHWNYRVMRRHITATHMPPRFDEEDLYEIIEAYYGPDGDVVIAWAVSCPAGETLAALRADLDLMVKALDRQVIDLADLPTGAS